MQGDELGAIREDGLDLHLMDELGHALHRRGLKLNHPEAVAWLSFLVLEGARDGKSVAELMQQGTTWLRHDQVMEGVPELVHEVQIEAVFPDGTKLVTLHDPIR